MESYRVVEHQNKIYEYNATSSEERADLLRQIIEKTKPEPYFHDWHEIIASQFRYPLPVGINYAARFRPPGSNHNVLYSSIEIETALYEHAFHFLKFRLDMKKLQKTGQRSMFSICLVKGSPVNNISNLKDINKIMDPDNYSASYAFIEKNKTVKIIQYPSCRDPSKRHNLAVRDINCLEKKINKNHTVSFSYRKKDHSIHWIENKLTICWSTFEKAVINPNKKAIRSNKN